MQNLPWIGLAGAVIFSFAASGAQATMLYDTTLQGSDYVNGAGNTAADGNYHWATDEEPGIELGLAGVQRYLGFYTPDPGTAIYHAATGQTTAPGKTGSAWGIEFSINTDTTGSSGFTLANTIATLCMADIGQGTSGCFDPTIIPDNAPAGSETLAQNTEPLSTAADGSADIIAAIFFNDSAYDINANDTYTFTLSLVDSVSSQTLGSVSATILAGTGAPSGVPEPSTLALFGTSLFGFGIAGTKRCRKAKA